MNTENKLARLMRNSGPARVLVPIGIILIVFGIIMFLFRPAGELVETAGTVTSVTEATADGDGKEQQQPAGGADYRHPQAELCMDQHGRV